jgi:hypothetical protein
MDADIANFELVSADKEDGNLVLKYKRKWHEISDK